MNERDGSTRKLDETQARIRELEQQRWTCPEHGEYVGGNPDYGTCRNCEQAKEHAAADLCSLHNLHAWWDQHAGVPWRYRPAVPASIKSNDPAGKLLERVVRTYCENIEARITNGEGLSFFGPPGLGKTLALCAIVNVACTIGRGPRFAVWGDVLADLKDSFNAPKDDDRRGIIDRLRNAPLLALDELGIKSLSDFDHDQLTGLIDFRYREGLPTLIATNATPRELPGMIGARAADRLREMNADIILKGDSQRGKLQITGPDALAKPPRTATLRIHHTGEWRERAIESAKNGFLQ